VDVEKPNNHFFDENDTTDCTASETVVQKVASEQKLLVLRRSPGQRAKSPCDTSHLKQPPPFIHPRSPAKPLNLHFSSNVVPITAHTTNYTVKRPE
jgi:hypothetical protein